MIASCLLFSTTSFSSCSCMEMQTRGLYTRYGLLDYLFFRNIRKQMGDHVNIVISGSAPLQPEVLCFLKAAFSCPVSQLDCVRTGVTL